MPIPIYAGGEGTAALRRAATLDGWLGAAYELDTIAELVGRLSALRREAGTSSRQDYEVMVGVPRAPSVDDLRRLSELGVTSVSVAPWMSDGNSAAPRSRQQLLEAVEGFGEQVLQRLWPCGP
jgi:alkanesulfonate monooxygenase SsuD/methylene tetrahydromethanopterin reductase-like flavin-dependent oxidoreductase (luciferase family)